MAGEIQRLRRSRPGHLYLELIEKGEGDEVIGKLEAVLWRREAQRVERALAAEGQTLGDGQQIRCRGGLDFYAPFGRLQLVVREIDPLFTIGLLARRRRETLEALTAAGLLERNRALPLAGVPLRVALITSHGSAAYHDFLSTLKESGYGFEVLFIHSAVQGKEAEAELTSALSTLGGLKVDCAILTRGGGSRTDLAVFDSREVAEAVALAPVPVLTGLGHEIDQAIADLVAHTSLKTPTGAAEFLVQRTRTSERGLAELQESLLRLAPERLRATREALDRAERSMRTAGFRLRSTASRLSDLGRSMARSARWRMDRAGRELPSVRRLMAERSGRLLDRRRGEPDHLMKRLVIGARGRLREVGARLDGWNRLVRELSPARTLERGFSVTRGPGGHILKIPGEVKPGETVTTQLAGGVLTSRVEER